MARSAIQFREGLSEVAATRIMAWKPNVRQHLISRYVPPHAIKEWSLGNGADAPVGGELQHRLDAQAEAHARPQRIALHKVSGGGRKSVDSPSFKWINTALSVETGLSAKANRHTVVS